ncbi:MAG TPA: energy transducer TonB [Thermomonas sp.]|nr:energy transducer TonB [Thermomonas sp.]
MKKAHALLLAGLLGATPCAQAAEAAAGGRDVVAFNASVRVEVDAAGKPVKVEAPADLPESIRAFIEKRVASWQYAPARQDGVPAAAVTFVRVGACAIPVAEGYRLGLDFKGNGPAIVNAGPWFMPPPRYPTEMQRRGTEGTFRVAYAIQADGTTKMTSIEPMEGTSNRDMKAFRAALTGWIEALRYQPEQVNGRAVATDMSFPVSFMLSTHEGPRSNAAYREELEARALASKECLAATSPSGPLPIAQNSPVKVTPVPAG